MPIGVCVRIVTYLLVAHDCCCSVALQQLEKQQGSCAVTSAPALAADSSSSADIIQKISDAHSSSAPAAAASRQRYPQPSLESLLSDPSPAPALSNARPTPTPARITSELDDQQLRLHIVALEQQVATLRDALQDAQEQCSLFEKQCDWFKKKELELQLSQDRNRSASDMDYLRRQVFCSF